MILLDDIRAALTLEKFDTFAAQRQMLPLKHNNKRPSHLAGLARVGAVLLLLYYKADSLHIILTRRRDNLNSHAGQISFPGGRQDAPETLPQTALRETDEEIGVPQMAVTLLGSLAEIYIPPSDYEVHPFVGWYHNGKRPSFQPAVTEVAEIIEVPLSHLMQPNSIKSGPWEFRGQQIIVPYYDVDGHMVWGATAVILSEFLGRLAAIMDNK